jgi:small-conductance mechanosensitive channel
MPALATPDQDEEAAWLAEASQTLETVDSELLPVDPDVAKVEAISSALKRVNEIRSRAQHCTTGAEENLAKLDETLTSLGEPQAGEPRDIVQGRKDLQAQRDALEQRLASCRLLVAQSQEIATGLTRGQQAILASRLLARGPNIYAVIQGNLAAPGLWFESFWQFYELETARGLPDLVQWLLTALAAVLGGALGWLLRHVMKRPQTVVSESLGMAAAFGLALRVQARRDLPLWLALAGATGYLLWALPLEPMPFVTFAAIGATLFALTLSLISLLLTPHAPAIDWLTRPPEAARALGHRLEILAALALIGHLVFITSIRDALVPELYLLARAIYGTALILNLVVIVWIIRRLSWALFGRSTRLMLMGALMAVLVAEYLGYRNLAEYLLMGLTGTLFGLGIGLVLSGLLTDLFDGLDEGRLGWQRRLRARLGLEPGNLFPGLPWVRLLVLLMVWSAFAAWAMLAWGLTAQGRSLVLPYITSGFSVGSLQVVPAYLLGGILALALLLNLTRYVKQRVLPRWLRHTRLDQGAREAIASVTGYTGIAVSILIALSVAGFEMQNLAIIAGALSVGIGFGLQNVVNNFVSGLILLFERPIRRGDWIVAGNTEGYVKSINIRSTQIQTFDRADVIVPNSELIAQQVTNWMLADQFGRVVVPVGVSYNSDPDQVRDVLIAVAAQHPLVVTGDPDVPEPRVLFRRFGDSSLDFELRCFIRKVDERLNTVSELNFEIFRAFRREGIEIPFPQRDLHLRSWPGRDAGDEAPEQLEPPA